MHSLSSSLNMSKPMKIGIIGYGNAARVYHLPYIVSNPHYIIHAFYQRSPVPQDGKPHVTIDYPNAKHYTDLDEFLKDAEIHMTRLMGSVVVEKPVATSHEEFQKAIEASTKSGKHLIPFQSEYSLLSCCSG
jgi:predicted dehydrogenase